MAKAKRRLSITISDISQKHPVIQAILEDERLKPVRGNLVWHLLELGAHAYEQESAKHMSNLSDHSCSIYRMSGLNPSPVSLGESIEHEDNTGINSELAQASTSLPSAQDDDEQPSGSVSATGNIPNTAQSIAARLSGEENVN